MKYYNIYLLGFNYMFENRFVITLSEEAKKKKS